MALEISSVAPQAIKVSLHQVFEYGLIPRWQYMTDESKALVKRGAVSVLVLLVSVVVLRALLPWVLLALIVWFVWSWARRP